MEAVMVLVFLVVGVVTYFILTRNSIVRAKNQVKRSWSDVLVHVQKKMKIIPKLNEEVAKHQAFEKDTLEALVKLRNAAGSVSNGATPSQVAKAESDFTQGLKSFKVSVEAYPNLKTSDLYKSLMAEIVEQQEDISAGISIYNRNVENFNNLLQEFPSSYVNAKFNKETVLDSFTTTEGVDESVGFKPNFK